MITMFQNLQIKEFVYFIDSDSLCSNPSHSNEADLNSLDGTVTLCEYFGLPNTVLAISLCTCFAVVKVR
jgi:hypothetical protein